VPAVHREFCAPKVLTVERLSGCTLDDLIAECDQEGSQARRTAGGTPAASGLNLRAVATEICRVWLRLALEGRLFPVEARAEDILVLAGDQIAFVGGAFATLPSDAKKNVSDYLIAASTHDPDKACTCLIKEMSSDNRADSEDELRHRLRQVVPFRDGGWSDSGESNSLPEHLFQQWRLAGSHGYRPRNHLLCFFRGLFWITSSTRPLGGGQDLLLEALEDLRMNAAMSQFRDMLGLTALGDNADKYATMMIELPKKLDDALNLISEGNALMKINWAGTERRGVSSSSAVIASLLVLASFVLLSRRLSSEAAGIWSERVLAIVFVAVGAFLLRALSSRGQR